MTAPGTVPSLRRQVPGARIDLSGDPGEIEDMAETHPEKLAELLTLWDAYVEENGVITDPITVFEMDPAMFG